MVASHVTAEIRVRALRGSPLSVPPPPCRFSTLRIECEDHVYRLYPLWRRGDVTTWLGCFSRIVAV